MAKDEKINYGLEKQLDASRRVSGITKEME
jgi:hypothetical protein